MEGRRPDVATGAGLGFVHRQESVAGMGALLALYRRIRHAALRAIDDKALLPPARSERPVRAPHGCGSGRTPGIEPLGHPLGQHGRQVPLPKAPRHYLQPPPRPEALQGLLRHKLPGNDPCVCAGVFVRGRGVRGGHRP